MDEECTCGYADKCDGEYAIFLPLGYGGSVAVRPCPKQRPEQLQSYTEVDDD